MVASIVRCSDCGNIIVVRASSIIALEGKAELVMDDRKSQQTPAMQERQPPVVVSSKISFSQKKQWSEKKNTKRRRRKMHLLDEDYWSQGATIGLIRELMRMLGVRRNRAVKMVLLKEVAEQKKLAWKELVNAAKSNIRNRRAAKTEK
nr:hypothetical protein [uncultured Nitrososphaera sp.]